MNSVGLQPMGETLVGDVHAQQNERGDQGEVEHFVSLFAR